MAPVLEDDTKQAFKSLDAKLSARAKGVTTPKASAGFQLRQR